MFCISVYIIIQDKLYHIMPVKTTLVYVAIRAFRVYNYDMEINRVYGMYFSATGTTEKVVQAISMRLADLLTPGTDAEPLDFTLPDAREKTYLFSMGDIVVFGMPTYAGRVPNLMLPFIREQVKGNGALCVPVVLFGNRNYDDSLIELRNLLGDDGFMPVAAGAFVGEHSFSYKLAAGRPDEHDMEIALDFACEVADKVRNADDFDDPVRVKGEEPIRPYYTPRDRHGNAIDIRKVKPVTGPECDRCGVCVSVCPMGAVSKDDPGEISGICIKCGACVKKCPKKCKFFDDEKYLYHMHELEEMYARRAEPETFI